MEEEEEGGEGAGSWKKKLCCCLSYFLGFLRTPPPPPPVHVFPIRVIDIPATLLASRHGSISFVSPTDWSFHVISHTWTDSIRQFSAYICHLSRGLHYDCCLRQADLRCTPAYHDLIEFMLLLADDGVSHIWFDTLCINQTDDTEKSQEIGRMGAFYSRSKGCYSLVHGIGRGYDLWPENNPEILPQWFHRVWTIQEFLLPKSLTFVTELPGKVQEIANALMKKANASAGFCKCCIFKDVLEVTHDARSPMELLQSSIIDDDSPSTFDNSINFYGQPASVCSECRTPSLVKRTKSGDNIYMVEREAYLFLLFLYSFLMQRFTSVRISEVIKCLEGPWDPWMVVGEVARRQCTFDEDRVLGILGLLEVGGDELQLRTGQTLELQLVHVAKYCDPGLLLKICAVDPGGGATPGMSWAPNFREPDAYRGVVGCGIHVRTLYKKFGHYEHMQCCAHLEPGRDILPQPLDIGQLETMANRDDEARMSRLSDFKRQVKVVDVTDRGMMLDGKVVMGQVMPFDRLGSKDREAVKAMVAALSPSPGSCQQAVLSAQVEEYKEFRLWREAGGEIGSPKDHTPTHCIQFEDDVGTILPLLVNLSWSEEPLTAWDVRIPPFPQLVMAYVGRPQNPIFLPLPKNHGALKALQSTWRRLEDTKLRIDMELWAVLLGTVGEDGSYHYVVMVCVGEPGNTGEEEVVELHKVGIFLLPSQIGHGMFGNSLPKLFRVGGFGSDLSAFVTVGGAATEKELDHTRPITAYQKGQKLILQFPPPPHELVSPPCRHNTLQPAGQP